MTNATTAESLETHVSIPLESPKLNNVLQLNQARSIRMQIGTIASNSFNKGFINDECYEGYMEVREGVEKYEMDLAALQTTIQVAKEYDAKAFRVYAKLQTAVSQKLLSDADASEMLRLSVSDNIDFWSNSEEVEKIVSKKISHFKTERQFFDEIRNHELIKNIGYLKLSSGTRIDIPSERRYLDMSADEREEELAKIKKALPEAEKHAANLEEEMSVSLVKNYKKRLDAAKDEGIIGQKTYDKYLKGIMSPKLDNQEREYWLAEFNAQMGRYRGLWADIHSSLKGEALNKLKKKADRLGYTELLAEFGVMKKQASKKLSEAYADKLRSWKEYGVIGDYTLAKFAAWFAQQNLKDRYKAVDAFEGEMQRYSKFWERVWLLEPEAQSHLRSKIDKWGYSDLYREYEKIKRGEVDFKEEELVEEVEEVELNDMTASARKAAVESKEILDKQTDEKKSRFSKVIKLFKSDDAADYEASIRNKKTENKPKQHIVLNDESDVAQLAANASDYSRASELKFSIKKDNGMLESLSLDEAQDVLDYNESEAA